MKALQEAVAGKLKEIETHNAMINFLVKNYAILSQLSDSAEINPYGTFSIWIQVNNREDLTTAMSLQPGEVWSKKGDGKVMLYTVKQDLFWISIRASDSALPPTCKVTTKTVTIPAQPERVETFEEITCDV